MQVSTDMIKELREKSGAGIMDCRGALMQTEGNIDKALDILKEKGLLKAQKKADRVAMKGLVESYIHAGGRVGALVEVNCETDFVARTDDFKNLAHEIAMQVTAMAPLCISEDEMPADEDAAPEIACLLLQPYIKDPTRSVRDIIIETVAKTGENIKVSRFARYELGE